MLVSARKGNKWNGKGPQNSHVNKGPTGIKQQLSYTLENKGNDANCQRRAIPCQPVLPNIFECLPKVQIYKNTKYQGELRNRHPRYNFLKEVTKKQLYNSWILR